MQTKNVNVNQAPLNNSVQEVSDLSFQIYRPWYLLWMVIGLWHLNNVKFLQVCLSVRIRSINLKKFGT